MTPKQALKFLIKEHVKKLLEGGLAPAPPESVAASRDMADRWAAIKAQGMGTGHGAAVLAQYRAASSARETAAKAKAEQDEKNRDDDEIIDRAIEYYNTGAGGWDGQDAARTAEKMTAKQKLRKGSELEQAKSKWQKEKDQAAHAHAAEARAQEDAWYEREGLHRPTTW